MHVSVIHQVRDIPADQWNQVSGTDHPFTRHEFLAALEQHNCVGAAYGWLPHHLVAFADDATPVGIMPLYLKDNSYGEFVFDWAWADAWQRAGRPYYPKLVCSIPYT
ncbi:MAG: peptidogalycan biosysnthesis protein, partial [Gammaproteobacteria bacterium]